MLSFTLVVMDAIEWLKSLDDECADCLVTDPAYESLEKHRKYRNSPGSTARLSNTAKSSNEWFPIFPNTEFDEFFHQVFRVMKYDRHMYIICDQETMFYIKPVAEGAGFHFQKFLIWDKMAMGMGYNYRAQHELVCFFKKQRKNKCKRKLNNLGICDILKVKRLRGGYPTEKPVKLLEILISQSTQEGEVVLDPFMGSGSALEASLRLKREFWGCDIQRKSFDHSMNRIFQLLSEKEQLSFQI